VHHAHDVRRPGKPISFPNPGLIRYTIPAAIRKTNQDTTCRLNSINTTTRRARSSPPLRRFPSSSSWLGARRAGQPGAVLNGCCLVAPCVIVAADSVAGQIWRIDLADDGLTATGRVWLQHDSMAFDPDNPLNPQPGVNGVRYASRSHFLYYTSTTKKLFMRVAVDPVTHVPAGKPEFVVGGTMADDFCIDEDAGVAYVTTHRENTIDRVPLEPADPGAPRMCVAGEPFTEQLIGPSSAAWGRGPGDCGRVAYVTTDGGTTAPPPDGRIRPAKVLRVEAGR
jgi:hypothetical protein